MKIRSNIVMIIILSSLLGLTCLGIFITKISPTKKEIIVEESEIEEIVPLDFSNNISNNYEVPTEIVSLIKDYMNKYFKSIYNLNLEETKDLFISDTDGAISDATIKLMIEARKLYDFDFAMSAAKYDLTITDYWTSGDCYYVEILEDDYFNFNFLNGITSEARDIECLYEIKSINGEYKINDFQKQQGYYSMFYDESVDSVDDCNSLYNFYFDKLSRVIEKEKQLKDQTISSPYTNDSAIKIVYNRDDACAYADEYYYERNNDWYDFSLEGGNCQNFASQVLYAGGIPMDYEGSEQWKCYIEDPLYDPEIEEKNISKGRSTSWVNVSLFYDYCKNNTGKGLVSDCDCNIYYAEPGDIIQVGLNAYAHTTIVSKVIDGHILVNSNTLDMKNFPLEAYTYPNRRLIKILGAN